MVARSFEVVQDDRPDPGDLPSPEGAPAGKPVPTRINTAIVTSLLLALKAISQRAYIALLDTFSLITAGAAFWLFYSFDAPTVYQIVHASIFAIFVLAINWIVRQTR